MPLKKIVKLLAIVAVFGISVAQAGGGANDYGIAKQPVQPTQQGK
ncbi:hypothetical protein [Deinococcus budaensis]|uniref:Uncharacterized protein n=1 Tax=Deinococcus budaensis TaxID=1665626 RepID=A0A7W8LQT9_9DEIO|nr:hypothetical protein [Deinococcus budaensis]MBB5234950.1 hypothetical protein [Deinococcus budaensis]